MNFVTNSQMYEKSLNYQTIIYFYWGIGKNRVNLLLRLHPKQPCPSCRGKLYVIVGEFFEFFV